MTILVQNSKLDAFRQFPQFILKKFEKTFSQYNSNKIIPESFLQQSDREQTSLD